MSTFIARMVTMRAVIRSATSADLDAIAAVHVAGFRAGNEPHLPPATARRMTAEHSWRTWRSLIEAGPGRGVVLVAQDDGSGQVAGVAAAGPSRQPGDDEAELYALYVEPDAWGTGHGAALDAAAREHLCEQGFATATLWVLEANERARRFYERRGWQADGERRDHLGSTTMRYRVEL
jgi:ribosomal protein S18 acetylase RimI-like enzyme